MSEQNKAAARRFFDLWEAHEVDKFDEVIAADAVDHDPQRAFPDDHGPAAAQEDRRNVPGGVPRHRSTPWSNRWTRATTSSRGGRRAGRRAAS